MQWLQSDLARARQVQDAFLVVPGNSRGVRLATGYRPAYDVGGDFYDAVFLPDGRVVALVGDVAGRGLSAALVMARVSTEFRRLAMERLGPRRVLLGVNQWLTQQSLSTEIFVTATCVQLEPARGQWRAANAGHPSPLVRRRGGAVAQMAPASGPPLGLWANDEVDYEEQGVQAAAGDIVILFTDGLPDAANPADPVAGLRAVEDHVSAAPHDAEAIRDRLLESLKRADGRPDDAALLTLSVGDETFSRPASGRFPARQPRPIGLDRSVG
jgi:serine phosphatase RsbU (regulator of sigma subunit)